MLAPLPTVVIDDVQQDEGNSGTTNIVFTVTRSGKTNGISTIKYTTGIDPNATDEAVPGEDFQPTSGTLVFASKEVEKTIEVQIIGDTLVEHDETFVIELSSDDNSAQFEDSRGVGTIANDDTGPSLPELVIDDVQLVEGDSGSPRWCLRLRAVVTCRATRRELRPTVSTSG